MKTFDRVAGRCFFPGFLPIIILTTCLLIPSQARCAIEGTPHDFTTFFPALTPAGSCSLCHRPHRSWGGRLSPDPGPFGLEMIGGEVGLLCGRCHYSFGGHAGFIGMDAWGDEYVYGAESHGHVDQMNVLEHPDIEPFFPDSILAYMSSSGLPYVGHTQAGMECTSCHNVHDNTNPPFLRAPINDLCSLCHPYRRWDEGVGDWAQYGDSGTWGEANTRYNNPGSHPSGADVTPAMNSSWQRSFVSDDFRVPFEAPGAWQSGGHLSDGETGGVVCTTCHAVHGDWGDSNAVWDPTPDHFPFEDMLQVAQAATALPTDDWDMPPFDGPVVAAGFGDRNTLCESCHGGLFDPSVPASGPALDAGTTGFGHPVGGVIPDDDGWVSRFAASIPPPENNLWPQGDPFLFPTGSAPVPICESCHLAHPRAASNVWRWDINTSVTEFTLRDTVVNLCGSCHEYYGPTTGHHPFGVFYDCSPETANQLPLTPTGGGPAVLVCGTCHTNSLGHNWNGPDGIGLAPGWLPYDNNRSADPATDAVHPLMSQTCMDCHFGADGDPNTYSPHGHGGCMDSDGIYPGFIWRGAGQPYRTVDCFDEPDFKLLGKGTHFMGDTGQTADILSLPNGPGALNPQLPGIYNVPGLPWPVEIEGASGAGWSRFRQMGSGNSVVIVCESCHELEPDKNNFRGAIDENSQHLLLANYLEGQNGDNGDLDGRDDFCEACHLPPGSHPLTGDIVSRTREVLDIDFGKDWLQFPTSPHITMGDEADDIMSCDACHQVHEAETDSANFILDADDMDIPAASGATVGWGNLVPAFPDGHVGPNHEAICKACHGR